MIDSWIVDAPAMPSDDYELKARYLRALYRDLKPSIAWTADYKMIVDQHDQADQWAIVKAEYEQLIPDRVPPLANILVDVWIEERELRGEFHDLESQSWRRADGSRTIGR